jgi:predicted nucleotidyltransferase
MVAMNEIEEFGAEKVILFGSYAQGTASPDSDVDLLIVAPFDGRSVDKSVQIRLKLHPTFPVDLLVRTPEKIRQRLQIGDHFIKDLLQEGKVLYEANSR